MRLSLFAVSFLFCAASSSAPETVPPAGYDAAQALFAHRGPHYGLEGAILGTPYRFLMITYEDILEADRASQLLSDAHLFCYKFPVINNGELVRVLSIFRDRETGEIAGGGRGGTHTLARADSVSVELGRDLSVEEIIRPRVVEIDFFGAIDEIGDTVLVPCASDGRRLLSIEAASDGRSATLGLCESMPLLKLHAEKRRMAVERWYYKRKRCEDAGEPSDNK